MAQTPEERAKSVLHFLDKYLAAREDCLNPYSNENAIEKYRSAREFLGTALVALVSGWLPIESAPRDGSRILGFGELAFETKKGIGTVRWGWPGQWVCDPNEASEYSPEECKLTHWMPLPEPPDA